MAAWEFKANGQKYIVASNTAGKWVVLDATRKPTGLGQFATRAAAMKAAAQTHYDAAQVGA
jgi:hypothetical protein